MVVQLADLAEPILLEVLHQVPFKELLPCLGASRGLRSTEHSSVCLAFRCYCAAYRSHLEAPPSFEELAAGAPTDLELQRFPWRKLCLHRASLLSALPLEERLSSSLTLTDPGEQRRGMIDAEHTSTGRSMFAGSQQAAVLVQPLKALPLARPIAYFEVYFHGGASVGLVDSVNHSKQSHIGWQKQSLGYHGDDGSLFQSNSWSGRKFGPTFGLDPQLVVVNDASNAPRAADVVGVGIDFAAEPEEAAGSAENESTTTTSGSVFFTKNGEFVGSVPWPSVAMVHGAFALHRNGDRASVNLGTHRFVFDVETFSQQPRRTD